MPLAILLSAREYSALAGSMLPSYAAAGVVTIKTDKGKALSKKDDMSPKLAQLLQCQATLNIIGSQVLPRLQKGTQNLLPCLMRLSLWMQKTPQSIKTLDNAFKSLSSAMAFAGTVQKLASAFQNLSAEIHKVGACREPAQASPGGASHGGGMISKSGGILKDSTIDWMHSKQGEGIDALLALKNPSNMSLKIRTKLLGKVALAATIGTLFLVARSLWPSDKNTTDGKDNSSGHGFFGAIRNAVGVILGIYIPYKIGKVLDFVLRKGLKYVLPLVGIAPLKQNILPMAKKYWPKAAQYLQKRAPWLGRNLSNLTRLGRAGATSAEVAEGAAAASVGGGSAGATGAAAGAGGAAAGAAAVAKKWGPAAFIAASYLMLKNMANMGGAMPTGAPGMWVDRKHPLYPGSEHSSESPNVRTSRASGSPTKIILNMDGRKVGEGVMTHWNKSMSGPHGGYNGFDLRMTPMPIGAGGN